jgi:metallophosphoesterase (TIGR00282 family)
MRVIFLGDVISKPGRVAVANNLLKLKEEYKADFCIVNGENLAGGLGITLPLAKEMFKAGADVVTTGNHAFSKSEIKNSLDSETKILRPANFPEGVGVPGIGFGVYDVKVRKDDGSIVDEKIGVVNLIGRVFMNVYDCPFQSADRAIEKIKEQTKVVFVDFHAEATSEKVALGWYLDGRVSMLAGTHTHVQTADDRILTRGTGYISDAGMTGPYDSVIGADIEHIIRRFRTCIHERSQPAKGQSQVNGIFFEVDEATGKTIQLERINFLDSEE